MAVDGRSPAQSSRAPRTVSPPSAHVKQFAKPQGADIFSLGCHSKRLNDHASPLHHKDGNEKNKKTKRKPSTDHNELDAFKKSPRYKKKEFEDNYPTVNNKVKKSDGASIPKFIKSRERAKRKGATSGTTKRKTRDRQSAVPHKESQVRVLSDSIEQQWPAVSTNHNERQQRVTSPEHTERLKLTSSPDYTATLLDDTKHRKPATSPDHTDLGKPAKSPGHAERRQPTSPVDPDQRPATTPKDGDRRKRRLVARGDSRAAAVAEAVAICSSNSAYPVWLRRR